MNEEESLLPWHLEVMRAHGQTNSLEREKEPRGQHIATSTMSFLYSMIHSVLDGIAQQEAASHIPAHLVPATDTITSYVYYACIYVYSLPFIVLILYRGSLVTAEWLDFLPFLRCPLPPQRRPGDRRLPTLKMPLRQRQQ